MATSSQKQAEQTREIAERRRKVARYYKARVAVADMAKALGVDERTIQRDIKFLVGQWEEEARASISSLKARELADLDDIERQLAEIAANKDVDPKTKVSALRTRLHTKDRRFKLLHLCDIEPTKEEEPGGKKPPPFLTDAVVAEALAAEARALGIELSAEDLADIGSLDEEDEEDEE